MSKDFKVQSTFREYSIYFVNNLPQAILNHIPEQSVFIIDEKVWNHYQDILTDVIPEDCRYCIAANEQNKTLEFCYELIKKLVDRPIRRNTTLVAIGGGIVQDITAFISSIIFRGIDWVFIPTTLLAQADSCIGSKTSINMGDYKNLLGNFYPPSKILSDQNFLKTLSESEIKSGIGEMLHFYFIAGSLKAYDIAKKYQQLLKEREVLKDYIAESLAIKKKTIEIDEFDKGVRKIFNYGHTFGHALETITQYAIPHGQAVTVGMDLANYISREMKVLSDEDYRKMNAVLSVNLPDFIMQESQLDTYLFALSKDKKNTSADLTCILSKGPGQMYKKQIPLDQGLKDLIGNYFMSDL